MSGTRASHRELRLSMDHAQQYAPQDNWVRCRHCPAQAAHVRDLVHADGCLGQRFWQDGAWHWRDRDEAKG